MEVLFSWNIGMVDIRLGTCNLKRLFIIIQNTVMDTLLIYLLRDNTQPGYKCVENVISTLLENVAGITLKNQCSPHFYILWSGPAVHRFAKTLIILPKFSIKIQKKPCFKRRRKKKSLFANSLLSTQCLFNFSQRLLTFPTIPSLLPNSIPLPPPPPSPTTTQPS